MKPKSPIPVTVLTGFLGAGKTTLLSHLLTQKHGFKCAVIINEFGAVGIDHQLVLGADEEVVELSNGCLCCKVRGDLIKSLENLFLKQKRFDYVLIETTGLADPGPIIHTFGLPDLVDKVRLDAVVTVTDARHLEKELADAPEAVRQVAFADLILLNKTDLVSPQELAAVEARIRRINGMARIVPTRNSQIEAAEIFNIKARELAAPLKFSNPFSSPRPPMASRLGGLAQERGATEHAHHDEDVGSFCLTEERALDLKLLEAWLAAILEAHGTDIYRCKGILNIKGQPKRIVIQGVQTTFDSQPDRFWNQGENRSSQMVFIGRNLDEDKIRSGFAGCAVPQ